MPEGMVIKKRLSDLLSLLESHVGDVTPKVPMVPRPPTLASYPSPQTIPTDKKRKRDKKARNDITEVGEIHEETPLEQTKGLKAIWSQ